jgi:hypothetical protein
MQTFPTTPAPPATVSAPVDIETEEMVELTATFPLDTNPMSVPSEVIWD